MASRRDFVKGSGSAMIDFDEIVETLRFYRRIVYFTLGVVAIALILWVFINRGGNPEICAKIEEIKTTTEVHERRADDIIDATKAKEEAAKNETMDLVNSRSADALPDLLAGLLADYRKDKR